MDRDFVLKFQRLLEEKARLEQRMKRKSTENEEKINRGLSLLCLETDVGSFQCKRRHFLVA